MKWTQQDGRSRGVKRVSPTLTIVAYVYPLEGSTRYAYDIYEYRNSDPKRYRVKYGSGSTYSEAVKECEEWSGDK